MSRVVVLLALLLALPATAAARRQGPGAPGAKGRWAPAGQDGFGTSATRASHVWFTLRAASMTEVYYPDLSHPSATSLQLFVDGKVEGGRASVAQADPASLTYRQTVATSKWRLTKTYVTDPDRMTVLVRVRFEAPDGKGHRGAVRYRPSLYNDGNDDVGWTRGHVMLAHDSRIAGALVARPAFGRTS